MPVTHLLLCANLKDYTDFIAHPLCLKGMEESLLKGKYRTGDAFFEDFKQIIANSRIYNANKKSEVMKLNLQCSRDDTSHSEGDFTMQFMLPFYVDYKVYR